MELLATSPIRDIEVILGKWLAAVTLYIGMLLLTGLNYAFIFKYGNPDWKPLAVGYLGMLLQAAGLLAIGTFISSLTKNQIIAGAATKIHWVCNSIHRGRAGYCEHREYPCQSLQQDLRRDLQQALQPF